MKKMMMVLITAALTLGMTATVFAAGFSQKDAVNKALKDAGLTSSEVKRLEAEYDDGKYEIEFICKSDRTQYDYEISASSGKILEKSVDIVYKHNYSNKKITKSAAQKAVARYSGIKLNTIKKGTCRYKRSDGEGKYVLNFKSGKYRYEFDVLAANGKIIEWDMERIGR